MPEETTTQMSNSILISIKKLLGLAADYNAFDQDVIININSAFFTLWQLGVGPTEQPFTIEDKSATWDEFVEFGKVEMCKMLVYYIVRLGFDAPSSSFQVNMINEKIQEYEWRLTVAIDEYNSAEG